MITSPRSNRAPAPASRRSLERQSVPSFRPRGSRQCSKTERSTSAQAESQKQETEAATDRDKLEAAAGAADAEKKLSAAQMLANQLPGRNTIGDRVRWGKDTKLLNQVQLSTYPDCIGGNLAVLESFIGNHLQGVVGGCHVLPFYPSSADRGFAPLTYKEVDPQFGSWDAIESVAERGDLCVDFMVNHISAQSVEFKDFVEKGNDSEYAELFIRYKEFWGGEPSEEDLAKIYTRKPRPPFREITHADGSVQKVWCTFDEEQIDIAVFSDIGKEFIDDQLTSLTDKGVNLIRLDAFGYTTKRPGTNCFFVEPEVWHLLDRIREDLGKKQTEVLAEVHEHYTMQKRLSEGGLWVYDFALPMLTLQALYDGDASNLKAWLLKCPRNQVTTLDTHDGLGVVDVADLMSQDEIDRTKDNIFERGANANMRYNGEEYGNLDLYQVNCSYYSAVGNKDDWYLLARAIQFFTPGIPLVYYVGLLAGENDIDLVERTKNGRDINRHEYSLDEAIGETERPIVRVLFELCRFRNAHPAFNGTFTLLDSICDIRDSVLFQPEAESDSGLEVKEGSIASVSEQEHMVDANRNGVALHAPPVGANATDGAAAGQKRDFMLDVVGASIDVVDSLDAADAAGLDWSLEKILEDGVDANGVGVQPVSASNGNHAEPADLAEAEAEAKESNSESDAEARESQAKDVRSSPSRFGWTRESGRLWQVTDQGHGKVEDSVDGVPASDMPFQPYCAALCNCLDDDHLLTPDALQSGVDLSTEEMAQQWLSARLRDPRSDLPASVLVAKWSKNDSWAVLEADLKSKVLRIIYVDPFDGQQKVWNVLGTYSAYVEMAKKEEAFTS